MMDVGGFFFDFGAVRTALTEMLRAGGRRQGRREALRLWRVSRGVVGRTRKTVVEDTLDAGLGRARVVRRQRHHVESGLLESGGDHPCCLYRQSSGHPRKDGCANLGQGRER